MITENTLMHWAERFVSGQMSAEEKLRLDHALHSDPLLKDRWKESLEILQLLAKSEERARVRRLIEGLDEVPSITRTEEKEPAIDLAVGPRSVPLFKYLKVAGVAAMLVIGSSLATNYWLKRESGRAEQKHYMELVRKVNTIEASQVKIIDSLNKAKEEVGKEQTEDDVLYGGTGFALTNDGYIATNYHVVKDANSIYVQTHTGDKLKAYIVAREPSSDIAILRLEDRKFRFGKTPLPYIIAKPAASLGQRVFTIGYPKDDIVYNEGYISCETGYEGDGKSYQLEMTANPGQSGSPVMDKYGTIVGLVTGKQSNTTGTTFAVHSNALVELVQSLPSSTTIHLPTYNKLSKMERTEQVNKIRDYIVSIKVN